MKNRFTKLHEYENKYGHIPEATEERLGWIYDQYKLTTNKVNSILDNANRMIQEIEYSCIKIVLFEEPEGSPRPRFRIVNRYNILNTAMANSQFVHVYSITGKEDNQYMKRIVESNEIEELTRIIYQPCEFELQVFMKTPSTFNTNDVVLAEMGLIRPINKPDWDNIGKKYSDMLNGNIWIDDTLVIDGIVRKFYSVKPRVEIFIRPINMLYNKQQYKSTVKKLETMDQDTSSISYFGQLPNK